MHRGSASSVHDPDLEWSSMLRSDSLRTKPFVNICFEVLKRGDPDRAGDVLVDAEYLRNIVS